MPYNIAPRGVAWLRCVGRRWLTTILQGAMWNCRLAGLDPDVVE